ncbi:related to Adiponectin receptor 1 [Ustilago bromivora]|uniref:Related to Adiponectin receptor 1 n=1 Tax=Ustilago bromivora TaxID=307758 RepID=A0A8H8QJF5_9BASI|nr:related to Adiponectin receptor 1 [Ustilago bromivora]
MAAAQQAVHRPRPLISAWLFLSSFVVAWDVGYILLRPRSFLGGDLHWIWSPYKLYMNIDYIYGLPSWDAKDGFPAAQSLMNVVECFLNLFYVYLVHLKATPKSIAVAPVWGLIAVTMTLSKTILYALNDYCCGWCKTGHNDWNTLVFLYILPNGLWILFPAIIALIFIHELSTTLKVAAGVQGAPFHTIPPLATPILSSSVTGTGAKKETEEKEKEKEKKDESNPYLVDHSQLPNWAQDNAWIVKATATGDGILNRALSFFFSSTSPSGIASKATDLTIRAPDTLDILGFCAFFVGSIVCLGFSSTYHAIQCHSHSVSKKFNKLDYVGIVVMIVGSFLPALHYGFYCHPHFQLAYSSAIILLGGLAMYVVLAPSYATPAYRPYRTAVFLVLGLSAVVPVAHVVQLYGYRTITETMGLRFLITSGALYVLGAGLYAARVPERFAPGRFDMLGASHQIFHVLIFGAAAAHYVSIRRAYAFWHTVEAIRGPLDVGREGVCAALQG